ncbi:elongator complex protein 4 isoform X1 [Cheilinus undulatus]|uniref:elongator complex protein 4 isoform X1 n=1 Tax=Cheilinus undulatus TaxID=241271 RepID=UPI001BD51178|nr:elongator complex protein 4 isoform X1 [Cheilinus undulatus]
MAAPMSGVGKPPVTSFQKKTRSKLISIPGTRPSVQNGQLLVSTGVTSLDYLLGGGLAVGTVLLIEEDRYDSFSRMILKYFLAEGVVCRHELFVAAAQDNPDDILQELPAPILDDVAVHKPAEQPRLSTEPQDSLDSMKIAWRYQNLPKVQTALASSCRFGHYYDVSKTMEPEIRQAAKCHRFYLPEHPTQSSPTHSPLSFAIFSTMLESYSALLKSLQEVIHREGFDLATPMSNSRNILRIGLHSLGSALWGDDLCCHDNPKHGRSLSTFLYGLRALLRSSLSVAVVTVPSHLIQDRALMGSITRLCDNAIALESFKGSERETNPLYKDYHGLLHVRQIPHLNCLASKLPDHKDLAFKLKRKQFTIERLHLPPDLSETVSRVSRGELAGATAVASACGSGSSGNKHLDF